MARRERVNPEEVKEPTSMLLKDIPVIDDTANMSQKERVFRKKKDKRAKKAEKKRKKYMERYNKEQLITNYTIVRYKPETYTSLRGLSLMAQIAMVSRYLFDKAYREEHERRKAAQKEEQLTNLKITLKTFIIRTLHQVPPKSPVKIQIDNMYSCVLSEVLNTTVELKYYDIEIIPMNVNYRVYIKKPHPLVKFTPIGY